MEQKAMGEFIAALRKANGMTQKELAEKLNVSDKSVSRWERGDGAPDLALIPVLAEVFGVTCDELLRGQRRPPEAPAPAGPDPKAEKQRRWLLDKTLARFRNQSFSAAAFAVAGVCFAAGIDLGPHEAALALCVGAVILLLAALVEALAVSNAFLAVAGEDTAQTAHLRGTVVRWAERVFAFIVALLAFLAPLTLAGGYGLTLGSWLWYGIPAEVAAGVLCNIVYSFLNVHFLTAGVLTPPEQEAAAIRHNARLLRRCLLGLGCACLVTFVAHAGLTRFWSDGALAPRATFDDWGSFAACMETEAPAGGSAPDGTSMRAEPAGTPAPEQEDWPDGQSRDEAMGYATCEITAEDGSVLCRFVKRNLSVRSWGYAVQGGTPVLPVWVRTEADFREGARLLRLYNAAFAALYAAEGAVCAGVYLLRKKRRTA